MGSFADNLQAVRARIQAAAQAAGRNPEDIILLAVSKTWPAESVRSIAALGLRSFGENYVQEGVDKMAALKDLDLEWHFIGPLQSNKTRVVAESFDWVHSVDRLKTAERLSAQRPAHLSPLNICVQVNVSGESSKSGCRPDQLSELCHAISVLPRLRLRGLMAIPAPAESIEAQRPTMAILASLYFRLCQGGLSLDTLSMGMSHDLEAAILEGSTMVRVGTALFGERKHS